jgi:high-affinity nickel permease
MISIFSIIALGFFLGMRHATDPDHVVAVTTIVSRERSVGPAIWIGALWGLGHTLTIFGVGTAIILAGWVIPTRIGLSMEFSVGLMLILLGVLNLSGLTKWIGHSRSHGDHSLPHSHSTEEESLRRIDGFFGRMTLYQIIRPFLIGIVHGLAGSAAVALLVLATIRQPSWAIIYLLVFGIGTIAGMMLITSAIAVPFTYTNRRFANLNSGLRIATATLSVGFGLFITHQIGFVNGLFTAHPNWKPR